MKTAYVVLFLLAFIPGFVYGILLIAHTSQGDNSGKTSFFFLWAGLLYIGCFFIVDLKDNSRFIFTHIVASTLGSVLLFVGYYFFIERNYRLLSTIFYALLLGVISTLPSSLLFSWRDRLDTDLTFYGIFLIYPIWQTAFSVLLIKCKTNPVVDERL
jgi:hypothetical protein